MNFTDSVYAGVYRDSVKHPDDRKKVLERAWNVGVSKIIITGTLKCTECAHFVAGNIQEAKEALELARTDARLYSTVGVHPTRCSEFLEGNPEEMMKELIAIGKEGKAEKKIVAVGEFGLDYDRLHFCDKEVG